ncbi:MAG: LamG domain-containing protein [Verrucomicrobiota bacterium]
MQSTPGNLWGSVSAAVIRPISIWAVPACWLGTWYHLVAVYDTDKGSLARYLNGQWLTSSVYNSCLSIDLGAAHIGAWNGTSRYIHAALDEFAIYPVALTADQVRTHYDAPPWPDRRRVREFERRLRPRLCDPELEGNLARILFGKHRFLSLRLNGRPSRMY